VAAKSSRSKSGFSVAQALTQPIHFCLISPCLVNLGRQPSRSEEFIFYLFAKVFGRQKTLLNESLNALQACALHLDEIPWVVTRQAGVVKDRQSVTEVLFEVVFNLCVDD